MKAILLISALAWTAAYSAPISKITTLRGKDYRQCEIVTVHPDGVSFTHANGAAKVLFTDLSKEWRRRLGYNPTKAAAYQKELADKRQQLANAKVKRQEELNAAFAEAEKASRFRELGLAAQADAARRMQAANPLPQSVYPVLPALGAVFDGRSIQQNFTRSGFATPWRGDFYSSYPVQWGFGFHSGVGIQFGGNSGFSLHSNCLPLAPICPPPPVIITPPRIRYTRSLK